MSHIEIILMFCSSIAQNNILLWSQLYHTDMNDFSFQFFKYLSHCKMLQKHFSHLKETCHYVTYQLIQYNESLFIKSEEFNSSIIYKYEP